MKRTQKKRIPVIRPGLPPAILGALCLLVALALIGTDYYLYVRYAVSVLALIFAVISVQYRKWWWALPVLPLAVLWNPAWPLSFTDQTWQLLIFLGSAAFLVVGICLRSPDDKETAAKRSVS